MNIEPPSSLNPRWKEYPTSYRAEELKIIARWINQGVSGSVVGLSGIGRSTLLNFLYYQRNAFLQYLPDSEREVYIIPIDLNMIPDETLATLYRLILRAFYQARWQFPATLQQQIATIFDENKATQDPFVAQTALLDILNLIQDGGGRVVWIINPFDEIYQYTTPQIVRTLRGLRDLFKETLCYIAGMYREIIYSDQPEFIRPLRNTLDVNVCWIRPLSHDDTIYMIKRQIKPPHAWPTEAEFEEMWLLTGGYPNLLRMTCDWWKTTTKKPGLDKWGDALLLNPTAQKRLDRIWQNLTREEQYIVRKLQHKSGRKRKGKETAVDELQQQELINTLIIKGICRETKQGLQITGQLFAKYIAQKPEEGLGKIQLDHLTEDIYQGDTKIEPLSPLERSVLQFFSKNPRLRLTHTQLIEGAWPDGNLREGVSTESLYQIIRTLRKKIEVDTENPTYIVNWRGQPEGGYYFFPEGTPLE